MGIFKTLSIWVRIASIICAACAVGLVIGKENIKYSFKQNEIIKKLQKDHSLIDEDPINQSREVFYFWFLVSCLILSFVFLIFALAGLTVGPIKWMDNTLHYIAMVILLVISGAFIVSIQDQHHAIKIARHNMTGIEVGHAKSAISESIQSTTWHGRRVASVACALIYGMLCGILVLLGMIPSAT